MRSYRSGQSRFLRFCLEAGLQSLPVSEQVLCCFVAKLGTESLSYQTIKCYLSAVRHYSIMAGHGDPFNPGAFPVLQYVLRGVRRAPRPPARPRLPITPKILRLIKSQWTPHGGETDFVMWAACCVGFFGFMRAGEFTSRPGEQSPSLTVEDIAMDDRKNPTMVHIHLKHSKTDPFRHGVDIYLGRTGRDLCPVGALLAFMAIRPAVNGPLFVFANGTPLTRDRLVVVPYSKLGSPQVVTQDTASGFGLPHQQQKQDYKTLWSKCWDVGSHQPINVTSRLQGQLWQHSQHAW